MDGNNYFIGGNFKNTVGIFVGGQKSILLSIFESEMKKNMKKRGFFSRFFKFQTQKWIVRI